VTPAATPRLTDCDIILVNSSAGKDSQATLDVVAGAAREAGVLDRLVSSRTPIWATPNGTVYPNSPQSTPHTTACDSRSPGVNRTMEQLRRSSIAYNSAACGPTPPVVGAPATTNVDRSEKS